MHKARMGTRLGVAGVMLAAATAWSPVTAGPARAAPANDEVCKTKVNGTPAAAAGQTATGHVLNVGGASEFATVWDPADPDPTKEKQQAAFPTAASYDVVAPDGSLRKRVHVSLSEGPDTTTADVKLKHLTSTDGAATFREAGGTQHSPSTRLRDGTLIGFDFKPVALTATTVTIRVNRSTDEGATWKSDNAVVQIAGTLFAKTVDGGPRVHGKPLELPDGTILLSLYALFNEDVNAAGRAGQRSLVAASTDGGRSFTTRGAIARDTTGTHSYTEAAIAQLPNGNLISVIRHQTSGGARFDVLQTPRWTTSSDGGATWTPLQDLKVSFPYGYAPFDERKALLGVLPSLTLTPNGVLVLSSGRPDNWVAISTNGLGTGWVGQLTYRNCPPAGYRFHGSTGNTGVAVVESNRIVQVGDNCDTTWACTKVGQQFTVDGETRVWRRFVDVLTPDVGKIDLATKYRLGQVTVATDMTWGAASRPRARVDGAFDGSTEYWSSAVRSGGPGSYVVRLDRRHQLTRIGLSLRNGRTSTGRVYASTDGVNWGAPIAVADDRSHLALEYFSFAAPVSAEYVKVVVDGSTNCDRELGAGCAFLNELELYSTVNSFENDPVNNRPRGFTELNQTWVTRAGVNGSSRALRLSDSSRTAAATAAWAGVPGPTKALEFRVKPESLPNAFLFTVRGRTSTDAAVAAFSFAVRADGSIAQLRGKDWHPLTAAGVVPIGGWSTVGVRATPTTATILLDGERVVGELPPTAAGAVSLAGYAFGSDGALPVGDSILIDDVMFS